MDIRYQKPVIVDLRTHPQLNERWVQDRIAEDPAILGLGDVILKDKERSQPRAGRLDLLFQEVEGNRRYEVEIQLGKTDESHIIRTIEYWDIERRRYPQYDHVAVLVAEEVTSRFLNVISLFNGTIPFIAIQVKAIQLGDTVSLVFTKVVDEVQLGLVDEDEETVEVADRAYWENRGSKATVAIVDRLLDLVHTLDERLELKYNKFYIGLANQGIANNFVIFKPRKTSVARMEVKLPRSEELENRFEAAGLQLSEYLSRHGRYALSVTKADIEKYSDSLQELFRMAHEHAGGSAE